MRRPDGSTDGAARRPTGRRRLVLVLAVAAVLAALVCTLVVAQRSQQRGPGLAGQAVVTASSTAHGFSAREAVSSGSTTQPGAAWRSRPPAVGAWIQLAWSSPHRIDEVQIVRNPLSEAGATYGYLSFGDGSFLQTRLATDSRTTVVRFAERVVDRVRFTATEAADGTPGLTVSEILVSDEPAEPVDPTLASSVVDGDLARSADVTSSGAGGPTALVDGGADETSVGRSWESSAGAWVELRWDRPQEIAALELVGAAAAPGDAGVREARLEFDGGSAVRVGGVLPDPDRPTIVAFLPRLASSVRLELTGSDAGTIRLSELRLYARGRPPAVAPRTGQPPASTGAPDPQSCPADAGTTTVLVIVCPLSGSEVGDETELVVALGPDLDRVDATVLGMSEPVEASGRKGPDGRVTLRLATAGVPAGPLTVEVTAKGGPVSSETARLQLVHGTPADGPAAGAPAAGRTLAYSEDFSSPVSLSRTGLGADYAAAKPVHDGAQDFGEAVFPDPAAGAGNVGVQDGMLHIGVEPLGAGQSDPQGWGRSHRGGLVASARQGGSGFAAQYGYFEARMFVPAAPGTWPAFWLMPSDNLVEPSRVVAEIDAVELYGHDPRLACHSTHEYLGDQPDKVGVARCGNRFATDDEAVGWHTYGVSVEPDANVFFIDGREVARSPQVGGGDAPMFFMLDLSLGGGWPIDLAATRGRADLYVDWVHVYV